jgi:transposase
MYSQGRSKLSIAEQTGISRNTAKKYMATFEASGLSFEQINGLNDKELDEFFGTVKQVPPHDRLLSLQRCFPRIDKELKKTGETRYSLWESYKKEFPDGFSYTQFCFHLAQWKARVNPVMHQDHKVGDKLYVDFAGVKQSFVNKETGEVIDVEVFIAILGASQLTYVEAFMSQQKEDLIAACENAFHYIGGVTAAIVPDNLKAAVTKSNRYEPTLNETFEDFATHYGTTILPTRAYRPRDKALVEGAVKIIYSRIYVPLRKQVFSSLSELNAAIWAALEIHNNQLLRGRNYSRRLQFEEIERGALSPLPLFRYEFKKQSHATVMKNGHVNLSIDKHYYSVPYRFIGKKVKLLFSGSLVEIYYRYERIALHKRIKSPYNYSTDKEHLASTHRFLTEWTPDKFVEWASSIHDDVRLYILKILDRKQHPEQAYRSCIGIFVLRKEGRRATADQRMPARFKLWYLQL